MKEFKVGDYVQWVSQSRAWHTRKVGKIVRVVNYGESPAAIGRDEFPDHRKMYDGTGVPQGSEVAYLVEVKIGKTDRAKKGLYMPWPQKLGLCKEV